LESGTRSGNFSFDFRRREFENGEAVGSPGPKTIKAGAIRRAEQAKENSAKAVSTRSCFEESHF
jgi:hypothetical protein